jgi:hypothetical protein
MKIKIIKNNQPEFENIKFNCDKKNYQIDIKNICIYLNNNQKNIKKCDRDFQKIKILFDNNIKKQNIQTIA